MSQENPNPAAVPHAAEDVQGDDRWMSQVRRAGAREAQSSSPEAWGAVVSLADESEGVCRARGSRVCLA